MTKENIEKEIDDIKNDIKEITQRINYPMSNLGSNLVSNLIDVNITNVSNGQTLIYNSNTQTYEAGGSITLKLSTSASAASSNSTILQKALDIGGDIRVTSTSGGVVWINNTLLVGSDTTLIVSDNIEIKMVAGTVGNMLTTKAYIASTTSVSITWVAGDIFATLTYGTAHGLTLLDKVWLKGNTDSAFIGVFDIKTVTNTLNIVIQLHRLPAATGGTNVVVKANKNITVSGGGWNYNYSGGNAGATAPGLHTMIFAGVYNLEVSKIKGYDTAKFLVNVGACTKVVVDSIVGYNLLSDLLKIYGPVFNVDVRSLSGMMGDDIVSVQTREPTAFATYRWTYGDCIGIKITSLGGSSNSGAMLFYPSTNEVMDGIVVDGYAGTMTSSTYHVRFDNNETGTTATIGSVILNSPVFRGKHSCIALGIANTLVIKNLVINNPSFTTTSNSGRFLQAIGTSVTANVTINGGYFTGFDNILSVGAATAGDVTLTMNNSILGSCWQPFSLGSACNMRLTLNGTVHENNPGSSMFNFGTGSPTIRFSTINIQLQSAGISLAGAGTPTYLPMGVDVLQSPTFSTTPTWNFIQGQNITPGVMTANITAITLVGIPNSGEQVVITLTQDAIAGRIVVWPANCVFPNPWVDAMITTDANKKCTVTFTSNGTQLVSNGLNKWA